LDAILEVRQNPQSELKGQVSLGKALKEINDWIIEQLFVVMKNKQNMIDFKLMHIGVLLAVKELHS